MGSQEPRWLHIGVDDDQAIKLLEQLAKDAKLRSKLEENPRRVLFRKFRIDFPGAPDKLKLPPAETIAALRPRTEAGPAFRPRLHPPARHRVDVGRAWQRGASASATA